MSHDAVDDEVEQEILNAAAQGAEYGFEKGFEAAVWHVYSIADEMPDSMPGVDLKCSLKKLAEELAKKSGEIRKEFMDCLEVESDLHVVMPGNSTEH